MLQRLWWYLAGLSWLLQGVLSAAVSSVLGQAPLLLVQVLVQLLAGILFGNMSGTKPTTDEPDGPTSSPSTPIHSRQPSSITLDARPAYSFPLVTLFLRKHHRRNVTASAAVTITSSTVRGVRCNAVGRCCVSGAASDVSAVCWEAARQHIKSCPAAENAWYLTGPALLQVTSRQLTL